MPIQTDPGLIPGLDGDSAGYLLVANDKIRVALVIVEDDIDLGVHPVVHTGVKKVTGRVTRVDGWRSPHGRISYSKPVQKETTATWLVMQFRRFMGEKSC